MIRWSHWPSPTPRWTHESHLSKFLEGHVVGGKTYGFRNVDVDAQGKEIFDREIRHHVEREMILVAAEAVKEAFELYAHGFGLKRIARKLTKQGAPSPNRRGSKGWSTSTVRAMLRNTAYIGIFRWNHTKKRDNWGQKTQTRRPAADWQVYENKDLAIIDQELWDQVQERIEEVAARTVQFSSGQILGRPRNNVAKNLLSGLAQCGVCGGGLVVETSARKGHRIAEYMCQTRRKNNGCANFLRIRVAVINEAILQAIEEHCLTPEAIEAVIRLSEQDETKDRQAELAEELKDVKKRSSQFVKKIEEGNDSPTVMARIKELEASKARIELELSELKPLPRLPKKVVEDRLSEWRRMLRSSLTQSRAVLQRLFDQRIVFTPRPFETDPKRVAEQFRSGGGYDFKVKTRYDRLFTGVAVPKPSFITVRTEGTEHLTPEDTFDGDYGSLLEEAQNRADGLDLRHAKKRKTDQNCAVVASPTGLDTFSIRGLIWRHEEVA